MKPTDLAFAVATLIALSPMYAAGQNVPIAREQNGWRVDAQRRADGGFELTAADRAGATRHVSLAREFIEVTALSVTVESKAVVVGATGAGDIVSIVALSSGALLETWQCQQAATSSDGRFVAYTEFFPNTETAPTAIYLIYDTLLPQRSNRMRSYEEDRPLTLNVGWAFYPEQSRNALDYSLATARTNGQHDLHSKLVWLDEYRVAFLDYSSGQTSAVLADFSAGITTPVVRVSSLPEQDLVRLAQTDSLRPGVTAAQLLFAQTISGISTSSGAMELNIELEARRGVVRRNVTVRFQ